MTTLSEHVFGPDHFNRSEWVLMASLMILAFMPGINDLVVARLASGEGIIDIIGQIEWFDTINETILAFLVLPLYSLFNAVRNDHGAFRNRISQVVIIGLAVYIVFTVIVTIQASALVSAMGAPVESVEYLRITMIGFVFDYLVQMSLVVLVVLGKERYVSMLVITKIVILALFNIMLMERFSYMGVTFSSVLCNIIMMVVVSLSLRREDLIQLRPSFDRNMVSEWGRIGGFSGAQILLDNIVYVLMVGVMVNAVHESGNYWIANSFIWSWLLIPISALSEIVRRDYTRGVGRMRAYLSFGIVITLAWVLTSPSWGYLISDVFMADDPDTILELIRSLMPFYVAYLVATILDSVFLSLGKTQYLFGISVFVNIVYYGTIYILFSAGMFEASLGFIILMFGFGMVVHMILSIMLFLKYHRTLSETDVVRID